MTAVEKKTAKVIKKINSEYKLTPKQSVFWHEWLNNGGNGTRAALVAYETEDENSAHVIANENLRKLTNPMKFYMEHKGIGLGSILQVLEEAMTATKWNDFTGDREPDHNIRLKGVDKLGKYMGLEPATGDTTNVQVNFNQFIKEEKNDYEI